ncbi:MAG: enoyl-CoA hydratase-related protein [Dongiaceae bacterium]
MSESILVSRDGDVATVTLNRPERLNALDLAAWRRIGAAVRELAADEGLRCIVLRGAGDQAFAAGADIAEFERERATVGQARDYGRVVEDAMTAVAECRHPTIALIRGACVGGGLTLAASCDLRICGAGSRFGVPINRLGLTMAYAELRGLVDLVGPAGALEILLEGRVVDAERALQLGLVNRVTADDRVEAEVEAAARRIADGAPLVARWHKKFIRRLLDPRPLTPAEQDESFAAAGTEDYRNGVRAFLAKQKPRFEGR